MIFTFFIAVPIAFIVAMVIFGIIVSRRDRNKANSDSEEEVVAGDFIENKSDDSAKWAVKNRIDTFRKYEEFIIDDFAICEGDEFKPSIFIDLIFFSKKGIFVIKAFDDEGEIVGDARDEYWMHARKGDESGIRNPIAINQPLVDRISNITNQFTNVFNLIVYTQASTAKLVNHDNKVIELDKLYSYLEHLPNVYDDTEIPFFYNKVRDYIDHHQ